MSHVSLSEKHAGLVRPLEQSSPAVTAGAAAYWPMRATVCGGGATIRSCIGAASRASHSPPSGCSAMPTSTNRFPWLSTSALYVGSVGKIVVALALFQALADVYPNDIAARQRVLKTAVVTADGFSQYDSHTVRMFNVETKGLTRRAIQVGDKATLWEFVDWMMSPSSNSAAGMVMREAMLLRQYGTAYPVPEAEIKRFFGQTPKAELTALFEKTFSEPITRNGLDLQQLRQGSFFTATGKKIVPGPGDSSGTARELMRYLLKMEEGRLVDEWSSREIKRLMYVTERRIRYASAPSLADAAVYFKSGSLYECTKEPGFVCGQYMGNVKNYMNSIAIIEYPAGDRKIHYMVTLISNVLRKNSAAEHQALAARLQQLIVDGHGGK